MACAFARSSKRCLCAVGFDVGLVVMAHLFSQCIAETTIFIAPTEPCQLKINSSMWYDRKATSHVKKLRPPSPLERRKCTLEDVCTKLTSWWCIIIGNTFCHMVISSTGTAIFSLPLSWTLFSNSTNTLPGRIRSWWLLAMNIGVDWLIAGFRVMRRLFFVTIECSLRRFPFGELVAGDQPTSLQWRSSR